MPDLQTLLDQIQERATRALGDEPHPHLDGPLHAQWIDHQRQCAEDSQQDAQRMLAALRAVVESCEETIRSADKNLLPDERDYANRDHADMVLDVLTDAMNGADHD